MNSTTTGVHGPSPGAVIAADWILLSIGLVMVLARLHLRLNIIRQGLFFSDAFIFLAWCSAAATSSSHIFFFRMGAFTSNMDYFLTAYQGDPKDLQKVLRVLWGTTIPFFTSFYLCKAAILAFYLQICPSPMRTYRTVVHATIAYTVVGYIVSISISIFLCFPVNRNWALDSSACTSQPKIVFMVGWPLHFSSDIIIFLLPFFILHKIQLSRTVLIGVYCTFGLGVINISVCLTRFLVVYLADKAEKPISFTLVILWSTVDANTGLLIACLPSLRPYLRRMNVTLSSLSKTSVKSNRRTRDFARNSFRKLDNTQEHARNGSLGASTGELDRELDMELSVVSNAPSIGECEDAGSNISMKALARQVNN